MTALNGSALGRQFPFLRAWPRYPALSERDCLLGHLLDPLAKLCRPLLDMVEQIHDCPVPLGNVAVCHTRIDALKRAEALVPNLGKTRIAHRLCHC